MIGFAGPALHASYLHTHWAGAPRLAQRLADAAAASSAAAGAVRTSSTAAVAEHAAPVEHPGGPDLSWPDLNWPDLNWHGDAELDDGLVDLAVNVTDEPQPAWLTHALSDAMTRMS